METHAGARIAISRSISERDGMSTYITLLQLDEARPKGPSGPGALPQWPCPCIGDQMTTDKRAGDQLDAAHRWEMTHALQLTRHRPVARDAHARVRMRRP